MEIKDKIKQLEALHMFIDTMLSDHERENQFLYRSLVDAVIQYAKSKLHEETLHDVKKQIDNIFNGGLQ